MRPDGLDAGDVAAFLRANPGWLSEHPELYRVLHPPRRLHGEAMADHMAAMLTLERAQPRWPRSRGSRRPPVSRALPPAFEPVKLL